MIHQISKKELRQIKALRKQTWRRHSEIDNTLVWIAPDGKAYKCDQSGMAGVKEMNEWNQKIKTRLTAQATLL